MPEAIASDSARHDACRLESAPTLHRWSVRAQSAHHAEIEQILGMPLPMNPLGAIDSENGSALWLGPDEWLVLMPPLPAEAFRRHLASLDRSTTPPCSIVDVSHRNVGVRLSGEGAPWVLNAGCPLNLSSDAFAPGACTRTLFGKAEIVLWRREAPTPEYHLECWRSFHPYVWNRLKSAIAELSASTRASFSPYRS